MKRTTGPRVSAKSGKVSTAVPTAPTRVWLRLLACHNLIEAELRAHLRDEFGTTLARFDVLAQVARPPAEPTMGELSRRLQVTKGNVTDVVGRLEADRLVQRRGDPADARIQRIALTERGRRAVATMIAAHNAQMAHLLRGVDAADLAQLDVLLGRLRTALREPTVAAPGDPRSTPRRPLR